LASYLSDYQLIFRNKTKVFFDKAQQYTQGILQSHRCNIEEISDTLLESNYFQLQHFISDSNWSYRDTGKTENKVTPSGRFQLTTSPEKIDYPV